MSRRTLSPPLGSIGAELLSVRRGRSGTSCEPAEREPVRIGRHVHRCPGFRRPRANRRSEGWRWKVAMSTDPRSVGPTFSEGQAAK